MNQFIESLKRLYAQNKISEDRVISLYKDGKITLIDKEYVLGK